MAMPNLECHSILRSDPPPVSVDFGETEFFKRHAALPEPQTVRDADLTGDRSGKVIFAELALFVKFGPTHKVKIEEAQTLQAIQNAFPNHEVPVPQLFGWRSIDGINFIYMGLVEGDTLETSWAILMEEEKEHIVGHLVRIIRFLRALTQATGYMGSVSQGRVQDLFFRGVESAGPYYTIKDYNDALQFGALPWLPISQRPPDPFRILLPDVGNIHFTHADLHLDNIIISGPRGSRTIAGIIDWGQSGWYPEYWEFCKMLLLTGNHDFYVHGWLVRTLTPYDCEYKAFVHYWSCNPP